MGDAWHSRMAACAAIILDEREIITSSLKLEQLSVILNQHDHDTRKQYSLAKDTQQIESAHWTAETYADVFQSKIRLSTPIKPPVIKPCATYRYWGVSGLIALMLYLRPVQLAIQSVDIVR